MINQPDLWGVRKLDADLVLELHAGDAPALVLVQGESRIRVDLSNVKGLVAALSGAAAELAELLAIGSVVRRAWLWRSNRQTLKSMTAVFS